MEIKTWSNADVTTADRFSDHRDDFWFYEKIKVSASAQCPQCRWRNAGVAQWASLYKRQASVKKTSFACTGTAFFHYPNCFRQMGAGIGNMIWVNRFWAVLNCNVVPRPGVTESKINYYCNFTSLKIATMFGSWFNENCLLPVSDKIARL